MGRQRTGQLRSGPHTRLASGAVGWGQAVGWAGSSQAGCRLPRGPQGWAHALRSRGPLLRPSGTVVHPRDHLPPRLAVLPQCRTLSRCRPNAPLPV